MTTELLASGSGSSNGPHPLVRGAKNEDYLNALSTAVDSSTLSSIDSPFQIQEYLSLLVAENPHNIARLVDLPRWKRNLSSSTGAKADKGKGKVDASEEGASIPKEGDTERQEDEEDEYEYVDRDVWLYEHLRRLAIDLSHPFVMTLQDHCSRETCPEMKAGEWLYLCAAHATANETECCAIDYITHTLDGATALLNSSRYFPSRLSIPPTSLKHFTSISRRLYRIFAHAWYHHREVFDLCESETSLYDRFLALSHQYELVSPDLLVIPSQSQSQQADEDANPRERTSTNSEGAAIAESNGSGSSGESSEEEDAETTAI